MEPFQKFSSRVIALPNENVDTDQIIPARFLVTTERTGLGAVLFYDWRYDRAGRPNPDFVLNRPESAGAAILLAGNNFGCGSSREHAPWALLDYGFRAIISASFADIFRSNCLKNGLLLVAVEEPAHKKLFEAVGRDPQTRLEVDLKSQSIALPHGERIHFPIDPFSKKCLIEGIDDLGYLLSHVDSIAAYEKQRVIS